MTLLSRGIRAHVSRIRIRRPLRIVGSKEEKKATTAAGSGVPGGWDDVVAAR